MVSAGSAGAFLPSKIPLRQSFSPRREQQPSNIPKSENTLYVEHPPFNQGAERFCKNDAPKSGNATYHVAYHDVVQPPRRATKGWSGIDDAIKAGRGTSTGLHQSSMAPHTAPPAQGSVLQPLYASYPNETRLQELLDLQRRRLQPSPGPGAYETTGWRPMRSTFRRPNIQELDGPFFVPDTMTTTTRIKEMTYTIRNIADSGLCPGDYEAPACKDATMRQAPAPKIGTGDRSGRTQHTKSLSISRSIQHGIDWHVPVIIQVRPAHHQHRNSQHHSKDKDSNKEGNEQPAAQQAPASSSEPAALVPASTLPRNHDPSPPSHPLPRGALPPGKPPAPPPAVARSVRHDHANFPGDWDWQRLGANYRFNWTTLHGGAYSLGDRTLARRDAPVLTQDFSHMQSISPPDAIGDMFPIPEESSSQYQDIGPAAWQDDSNHTPDTLPQGMPQDGLQLHTVLIPETSQQAGPATAAAGHSQSRSASTASAGAGGGGGGEADAAGKQATPEPQPQQLLPSKELGRRQAAAQAAASAQQINMRQHQWLQRSNTPLAA